MAGRVLLLGLPYFGRRLAAQLRDRGWQADFHQHPGGDLRGWARLAPAVARADVVYLISSRMDAWSPQDLLMRIRRRPVVIHWVGTDVLIARERYEARDLSARLAENATHWCDAPWLVGELAAMGIRSEYVPLPVPLPEEAPPPLPEQFRVLLYLPVDSFDREVFDTETILALPGALPDVEFVLIPSPPETLPQPLPANLEAREWVEDMTSLYEGVSTYVRLTSHDGMSFMALEALARGRYVIWTQPLAGAIQASGIDAVAAELRSLQERHQRGELGLNSSGREAALTQFQAAEALAGIDERLRALIR